MGCVLGSDKGHSLREDEVTWNTDHLAYMRLCARYFPNEPNQRVVDEEYEIIGRDVARRLARSDPELAAAFIQHARLGLGRPGARFPPVGTN